LADAVIVEVPSISTVTGLDEQEMAGGLDCFTVKLAQAEATPVRLPSLRFAVTW